jgi:hypothetical protein
LLWNTYILERNTQPILDGVDHLCWTSLILPTGSEHGEEQGIRGVRLNGAAVRDSENLQRVISDGDLRELTFNC